MEPFLMSALPAIHRWSARMMAVSAVATGVAAASLSSVGPAAAQGTLRIAMTASDIPQTTGQPDQGGEGSRFVGYPIYDSLVLWDLSSAEKASDIVPGLATEWHVDPADHKRWIFKLRDGVFFHDGSPFNADAVIWNFEKVLNEKSPQFDPKQAAQVRSRMPSAAGYTKIDDATVAITTTVETSLFPYEMSYLLYSSPKQWENVGRDWNKFADRPSGTGPFKVDRLVLHERLELSPNKAYWDKARVPKLDHLILFPIPDASTRTSALLSGRVDWIEAPAPDAIAKLKQSGQVIVLNTYPHSWGYAPSFAEGSPWRDIRVRKAANLCADREGMVKLLAGTAEVAAGQVQKDDPWFGKPSFKIGYDLAAAKKLMTDAGYGPDKPARVKIAISTSGSGQMQPLQMNEYIQENLKECHFDVQFDVMEWNALTAVGRAPATAPDMVSKGDNAVNISRSNPDPYTTFVRLFDSRYVPPRGANWGLYKNPALDKVFDELYVSYDKETQTELMAKAHTMLVDDAAYVWFVHDLNPRAMSPKVKGFIQARSWYQDFTRISMQ